MPLETRNSSTKRETEALTDQALFCRKNDAPITARVVSALRDLLDAPQSEFLRAIADWQGDPLADALALRAAGALHSLHLCHETDDLAPIYANASGVNDAVIINAVCRRFDAQLLPWLESPPQTNEAARSATFITGLLWLAEMSLPPHFDIIEIGSSAGIDLMMDRYHYDLAGVHVGPQDAPLHFQPEWRGHHPPQHAIGFTKLRGCDQAPVDLRDETQALRLKSFIWPDHSIRFARLEAAIQCAHQQPPDINCASAADYVEAELAKPQQAGTTRVLVHSVVWQYIAEDQQRRIQAAMDHAGQNAAPDRPLAWISMEPRRDHHRHELRVRHWPKEPEERLLAYCHPHAAWIEWTDQGAY
jgi:hypothetical protein